MTKDRLLGIIAVTFAACYAALTFFTVDPKIRIEGDPGSQIFPYATAMIFMLAGITLILRKSESEKPFLTRDQWKRLFSLFAVFIVYVFLIWLTGFLIGTMITLFIISTMFAKGKPVSIVQRICYSVVMTLIIWAIFRYGLKVLLPSGMLGIG